MNPTYFKDISYHDLGEFKISMTILCVRLTPSSPSLKKPNPYGAKQIEIIKVEQSVKRLRDLRQQVPQAVSEAIHRKEQVHCWTPNLNYVLDAEEFLQNSYPGITLSTLTPALIPTPFPRPLESVNLMSFTQSMICSGIRVFGTRTR